MAHPWMVVTDGGSLVVHASLVARECGIPAVVGLGDTTRRVRDGQRITIDGSTGLLELHDEGPVIGLAEIERD